MPGARVLALHGYLQTGSVLSSRVGHLRKSTPIKQGACEFIFLDAPYRVEVEEEEEEEEGGGARHRHVLALGDNGDGNGGVGDSAGRSWWQFRGGTSRPSASTRPSQSTKYDGIEVSVRLIERAVVEHKIDTIMGFSQGAAMAAYFCATQDVGRLGVKRLLAYAGFLPNDARLAKQMLDRAPIPSDVVTSVWVSGDGDEIITTERSKAAAEVFEAAVFHVHPGGHMVPSTRGELKTLLADFLITRV